VAGTTSARFRPTRSYTNPRDVTWFCLQATVLPQRSYWAGPPDSRIAEAPGELTQKGAPHVPDAPSLLLPELG